MSFSEFQNTKIEKLGLHGVKWVEKLFYKILISVLRDDVKYDSFVINSDEDLQVLFYCRSQFSEVRTLELLAKFVDVVCSSRAEAVLVASPSFAIDINCNRDGEVGGNRPFSELAIAMAGTPIMVPIFGEDRALDGVENILRDDDDDNDVDRATIDDDSDDDIARSIPAGEKEKKERKGEERTGRAEGRKEGEEGGTVGVTAPAAAVGKGVGDPRGRGHRGREGAVIHRGRRRETAATAAPPPSRPAACAATVQLEPPPRHSSPSRGSSEPRERAARGEGGVAIRGARIVTVAVLRHCRAAVDTDLTKGEEGNATKMGWKGRKPPSPPSSHLRRCCRRKLPLKLLFSCEFFRYGLKPLPLKLAGAVAALYFSSLLLFLVAIRVAMVAEKVIWSFGCGYRCDESREKGIQRV
ncbi:hypothetical protein Ahy_B06g080379 [Arachis hypogaea]|uniref:Uncharacterized protein n=1 Tax=Arachis hypogaea TaxID=3818 RepID=A0A444YHY7_ARAHY|nr:hypothetical protein Ahy_B06g080379 [Arachis hypogaea]